MRPTVIVLTAAALVAGGCGTSGDREDARAVTEGFYAAVREGDGRAACELMSRATVEQLESQTGQACDDVVTRLEYRGGEVAHAEVFVTNARVELTGGESAFLSREPEGWRLSALACAPEKGKPRDRPFECEVEA